MSECGKNAKSSVVYCSKHIVYYNDKMLVSVQIKFKCLVHWSLVPTSYYVHVVFRFARTASLLSEVGRLTKTQNTNTQQPTQVIMILSITPPNDNNPPLRGCKKVRSHLCCVLCSMAVSNIAFASFFRSNDERDDSEAYCMIRDVDGCFVR